MNAWTALTAVAVVMTLAGAPVAAPTDAGSAEVQQVQKALKAKGHDPGRADGVLGPQTSAALKAYQQAQGLNATGQLDDATLAKLGVTATTASRPGQSGAPPAGGDAKASAVDPAQGTRTGANVGEGASYSRSTEKGLSTMPEGEKKK